MNMRYLINFAAYLLVTFSAFAQKVPLGQIAPVPDGDSMLQTLADIEREGNERLTAQIQDLEDRYGPISFTSNLLPYMFVGCLVLCWWIFRNRAKMPEWLRYREWLTMMAAPVGVYWFASIIYIGASGHINDISRMRFVEDTAYCATLGLFAWFVYYLVRRIQGKE